MRSFVDEPYDSGDGLSLISEQSSDHGSEDSTTDSPQEAPDGTGEGNADSVTQWAEKERKAVQRIKYVVVLLLALACVACGWFTYYITKKEEQNRFETKFQENAKMLTEISEIRAKAIYTRIQNMATTITAYTEAQGTTWPFATIPQFEATGLQTNAILNTPIVALAPIVPVTQQQDWETYSVQNQGWVEDGVAHRQSVLMARNDSLAPLFGTIVSQIPDSVHQYQPLDSDIVVPYWQMAPAPEDPDLVNLDLLSHPTLRPALLDMIQFQEAVLSPVVRSDYFNDQRDPPVEEGLVQPPHSVLCQPIYRSLQRRRDGPVVAAFLAFLPWTLYLENVLPDGIASLIVVVDNTCGDTFSVQVQGRNATPLGMGGHQDPVYQDRGLTFAFEPFLPAGVTAKLTCPYTMTVYPTKALQEQAETVTPVLYTTLVVLVFCCTTMVFFVYDFYVTERQDQQAAMAIKSNAIVSNMFPSKLRKRIMDDAQAQVDREMEGERTSYGILGATSKIKTFLHQEGSVGQLSTRAEHDASLIADHYSSATVMFSDIVGFTSWSSVRSPEHVFILLETLYHAFDEVAIRRRVYKVETIGDCYVAASGVPEPRDDHAVVMARFSNDIQKRMNDLTKRLEIELGPGTGDLTLRIGLHSGALTAGVIRGDKARFQLFGATVDKAARMESYGQANRIHLSQETAAMLMQAKKGSWLQQREGNELQDSEPTFWLDIRGRSSPSAKSGSSVYSRSDESAISGDMPTSCSSVGLHPTEQDSKCHNSVDTKNQRSVNWIAKSLEMLLLKVVARRMTDQNSSAVFDDPSADNETSANDKTVIDEVQEIITLPQTRSHALFQESGGDIQLSKNVVDQLGDYITIIASMYKSNPFHNFDHASHVCMSVNKLFSRIVAPDDILDSCVTSEKEIMHTLHDHTHGITSDPLTWFAVVFSALIHDVDHDGVPNAQLVMEEAPLAKHYKNKAVAEQNSIDLAFGLLYQEGFADLRAAIHATESEKKRFRQLCVNSVIATDIADKQLKELRNARWNRAFKLGDYADHVDGKPGDEVNRKATIVLEHLIQASDVAHTMQYWQIYRKWNECLFAEMALAYKSGRAERHPSEYWYKGELGFFDFYIIPLAKKLKECGVFGVSSDEYLNYALQNRRDWEASGEDAVAEMMAKYKTVEDIRVVHPAR